MDEEEGDVLMVASKEHELLESIRVRPTKLGSARWITFEEYGGRGCVVEVAVVNTP